MILEKDKDLIDLPEDVGDFCQLVIYSADPERNPLAIGYVIPKVQAGQVMMHSKEEHAVRAMPAHFAILSWGPQLQLYPAPDKDYFARFTYTPKPKQL